jgi:hypothetical protein
MSQRLILCVEGYTEKDVIAAFFKRWLDKELKERDQPPVGISSVRFEGWSDLVREMPDRVRQYIDDNPKRDEIIAVIGLIDLYGPNFYPSEAETVKERYAAGRKYMEDVVNHERFRQFFAVHETEAWLLSEPALFQPAVRKALAKVSRPETINFKEPPAKMLNRIFQTELKQDYKKVVQARNLFPKLDPDTVYAKCPYFAAMVDELLNLIIAARS